VALAQRISGELRLQVTDPTGAGLRSAGSIVSRTAGVDRTFDTDESGRAVFRALPPGRYELTIRSQGFTAKTLTVEVQSQLPVEQTVGLEVTPLSTTVEVKDETLLDPIETARYVPRQALEDRASVAANRAVINLVNGQPGWVLEANGSLHPRGSEYDVQYVIDGVPLYDNRSPAFAQSLNIDEFDSLNVRTAGYPAEFGLKARRCYRNGKRPGQSSRSSRNCVVPGWQFSQPLRFSVPSIWREQDVGWFERRRPADRSLPRSARRGKLYQSRQRPWGFGVSGAAMVTREPDSFLCQ
jgi:hypothetical protein